MKPKSERRNFMKNVMPYQDIVDKLMARIRVVPDYENMTPQMLLRFFETHYGPNALRKSLTKGMYDKGNINDDFILENTKMFNPHMLSGVSLAFHAWNKNKQVYTFSRKFLKDLLMMEDSPIYISNLPYEGFYLDLKEHFPQTPGAFIFYKKYRRPYLSIVLFDSKREIYFFSMYLDKENVKISDITFEGYKAIKKCFQSIMQILNYLSSSKPDIMPVKKNELKKDRRPVLPQKEITEWAVGTRYVREYAKKAPKNPSPKTSAESNEETVTALKKLRHSPRAHVRKAHWQVYWTGPGRKVAVTRWVKPIFVNTGNTGLVVHEIGGKNDRR